MYLDINEKSLNLKKLSSYSLETNLQQYLLCESESGEEVQGLESKLASIVKSNSVYQAVDVFNKNLDKLAVCGFKKYEKALEQLIVVKLNEIDYNKYKLNEQDYKLVREKLYAMVEDCLEAVLNNELRVETQKNLNNESLTESLKLK